MELLQTYGSFIGSVATVAFGYGVLNNRMKSIEEKTEKYEGIPESLAVIATQVSRHESLLGSQGIVLQQIAVDVAIIRTKFEENKKK